VTLTLASPPSLTTPDAAQPDACCVAGTEPPLQLEEAARYVAVLKALADPHRLRMLALMAAQPASEPLCACDVEASFELSQPTISHHLRVLREAGLVTVTKRGLWHYYAPATGSLAPLRDLLTMLDTGAGPGG
jgi:ArsR family transcriptional regulator, arsenate/arsenite/antimonite-responsive transcriptional repressor